MVVPGSVNSVEKSFPPKLNALFVPGTVIISGVKVFVVSLDRRHTYKNGPENSRNNN